MDNDSIRINMEGKLEEKEKQHHFNAGYNFQPAWLRRAIQSSNGLDRFLLDYGYNFLPYIAGVIYIIFLLG